MALAYLDLIQVGIGQEEYAEPFDHSSPLTMPMNALVNVLYPLCGLYWIYRSRGHTHGLFFYVMAIMTLCYGPIQFMRITTQERTWALIDQWVTLPFFGLVVFWSARWHRKGNSPADLQDLVFLVVSLSMSVVSFVGAVLHPRGFDFALAVHILLAVCIVTLLLTRVTLSTTPGGGGEDSQFILLPFLATIVACSLFVALKLLDFVLPSYHPVFRHVSGHFLSKIADAAQIHFILLFFDRLCQYVALQKKLV